MARPISDEELQLKKRARRRLVGAIVLVATVAVVLPMVLDSEPRSVNQDVDINIPSPDDAERQAKLASPSPTAKSADPTSTSAGSDRSGEVRPPAARKPGEPEAPEPAAPESHSTAPAVTSEATAPTRPREPPTSAAPAAASGAYVVQVAALSDSAKARQLAKRMASAGLKSYTEVINTQAGEVTRVRAGPFGTREAAEKARTQLKKAGLEGKVVAK